MIVNKIYSRIDWKNYPNTSTALNETNLNRMDKAIDDLDNRVIEQDSTKADQTTVNNMVKNWTMDETTGVITVEKQDGSKIMFDLNIEKIPVSFELSSSGILTMTTSDGTQFTANIGSMIPVLTFNESEQIAVSVSGSGVNKTYSFTVKDGSITESKLQPNYLADIKSESAKAKMSETNAEKFKNESEKIYEAMKRLEHKIEVNENEPSDLNVNDEWLNFYGTGSDFNKAKNYVKTAKGYKLLSRWTSSDTVDVNGKTLTETVDELKKTSQDNGYGEVAGGKNLFNGKYIQTVLAQKTNYTNRNLYNEFSSVSDITGSKYDTFGGYFKKGTYTFSYTNKAWFSLDRVAIAGNVCSAIALSVRNSYTWTQNVDGYTYFTIEGDDSETGTTDTPFSITPNIQIEEGSVATEYEPYFPSNKMLAEEKADKSETTVNLLNPTLQTTTQNGVTCTNNGDGTYTLNGTNTNTSVTYLLLYNINIPKDVDAIIFGSVNSNVGVYINGSTPTAYGAVQNSILDVDKGKLLTAGIAIKPNATLKEEIVKPMITTNLDATYDDFVPYTGDTGSLNGDVAKLKNDLDKLSSLPIGSIIQIEKYKDDIETTKQKYGWQYLGTSNIQYNNGSEKLLVTNVYRKNN